MAPLMKRYKMPARCSVGEIVLRELLASDEVEIAKAVDRKGADSADVRVNESIRYALAEVDGVPVNEAGIPYAALDSWSLRTMRFAMRAFFELNGTDEKEADAFAAAGEIVNAHTMRAKAAAVSPADIAQQSVTLSVSTRE